MTGQFRDTKIQQKRYQRTRGNMAYKVEIIKELSVLLKTFENRNYEN